MTEPTVQHKTCTKCGETKPLDRFGRDISRRDGLFPWCRDCKRDDDRQRRQANPESYREPNRQWKQANPGQARDATLRWRQENPERVRDYGHRWREKVRVAVFNHYGRVCACCGATDDLNIDHVAGNGKDHRVELFGRHTAAGMRTYVWLVRNGFPEGFQTLCKPCNRSKSDGERCRLDHSAALSA